MHREKSDLPDAAKPRTEAGATPPFDASCVTVAVGSLPPQRAIENCAVGLAASGNRNQQ